MLFNSPLVEAKGGERVMLVPREPEGVLFVGYSVVKVLIGQGRLLEIGVVVVLHDINYLLVIQRSGVLDYNADVFMIKGGF